MNVTDVAPDVGPKKRRAEAQMRKEDVDSEEDDNVHPMDRVSVDTGKGIQKASADELASRRFVRVRRRGQPAENSEPVPVPSFVPPSTSTQGFFFGTAQTTPTNKQEPDNKTEPNTAASSTKAKEAEKKEAEEEEEEEGAKPKEPLQQKEGEKKESGAAPATVSAFSLQLPADSSAPAPSVTGFFFGVSPTAAPSNQEEKKQEQPPTITPTKKEGWECACCTELNPLSAPICNVCLVPRMV